jgi:virginiamycin B lyase
MGGAARPALAALQEVERKHPLTRIRQDAAEARQAITIGALMGPEVPLSLSDTSQRSRSLAQLPFGGICRLPKAGREGGKDGWKDRAELAADLPTDLSDLARSTREYFVTYAVDGGLLVGTSSFGDLGGEVVWVKDGREQTVTKANVFAIVARPWGLVLLQGLLHSGRNDGTASILSQDAGRWTARPFLDLLAEPQAVRELPDGGLGIATEYGTVTLDGTGAVQGYDCMKIKENASGEDADLPPAKKIPFKTFKVPTVDASPTGIAVGPDRALWFTELRANKIGRVTTSGAFNEYRLPASTAPGHIVAGPDGALWFTEQGDAYKIGRITTSGAFTEYPLPPSQVVPLLDIVVGPDKALWFLTYYSIGRLNTSGAITLYNVPAPNFGALTLASGPDGAIWSVAQRDGVDRILRLTTAGVFTERLASKIIEPVSGALFASDGALWFTIDGAVARATSSGAISIFPTPGVRAERIGLGPDGSLWISGFGGGVGRMTLKGDFTRFDVPAQSPGRMVAGPDGAVWLTDSSSNSILRLGP